MQVTLINPQNQIVDIDTKANFMTFAALLFLPFYHRNYKAGFWLWLRLLWTFFVMNIVAARLSLYFPAVPTVVYWLPVIIVYILQGIFYPLKFIKYLIKKEGFMAYDQITFDVLSALNVQDLQPSNSTLAREILPQRDTSVFMALLWATIMVVICSCILLAIIGLFFTA